MTEERKYIYSIIKIPYERYVADNFRLSESIFGIDNRGVMFIPYRDIAAAISNIRLMNIDKLDKEELVKLVAAHEEVNIHLMKKRDVVPMRFGMIAENIEEIRNILTKAYLQFKTALERMAGKAEFVVQVFWNEKNILEKLVQENIEIQQLKRETESKGEILGLPARMKLGKRVCEAIEGCRKEYAANVLKYLTAYFPDFTVGKLLKINQEEVSKEILMNHSFLINKTKASSLEAKLNKLAEKYKNELRFKYIGPMAPYSFAAINLEVGNFDLVDNARRVLELGESAMFPEIRNAYYKLAHKYHPDKRVFTKDQIILEEAEQKMKDIITANGVLNVYCKHYLSALAPDRKQICSFKKEDVEESIIVKES